MTPFVALDDVSHVYGGAGGTLAVEGLSINVNRGEFAAVVGPSGCGKSTLMKLATGLQFPFKGTVRVDGATVDRPVKIAGMAFQAPTLLPWRSTLENLLLPLEIVEPQLLMLDEPFGALDAFTREELWCVIRDLHAARKITIILVTHDLREAVFLADRIFVMSARPGRILAERVVDLPRPRDLDVTFTQGFQDVVHELRSHIVKARQ